MRACRPLSLSIPHPYQVFLTGICYSSLTSLSYIPLSLHNPASSQAPQCENGAEETQWPGQQFGGLGKDSECDVRPGVRAAGTQWGAGQAYWHVGGQAGRSQQQPAGSSLSDLPSHNSAAAGPSGQLRSPLLPCITGLRTLLDPLQTAALALHRPAHFLRQQLTWAWTCSPLPKVSDLFT